MKTINVDMYHIMQNILINLLDLQNKMADCIIKIQKANIYIYNLLKDYKKDNNKRIYCIKITDIIDKYNIDDLYKNSLHIYERIKIIKKNYKKIIKKYNIANNTKNNVITNMLLEYLIKIVQEDFIIKDEKYIEGYNCIINDFYDSNNNEINIYNEQNDINNQIYNNNKCNIDKFQDILISINDIIDNINNNYTENSKIDNYLLIGCKCLEFSSNEDDILKIYDTITKLGKLQIRNEIENDINIDLYTKIKKIFKNNINFYNYHNEFILNQNKFNNCIIEIKKIENEYIKENVIDIINKK